MRILLIRHGRQNSPLCNVDVPLSEAGRAQAALLGERLKHEGIDAVWSSGLCRAVETADRINEALKVKRVIREDLKEISFGDLEGLADPVIAERFGSFLSQRKKMEQDLPYPGGESAADVVKRVLPVMDEILASGDRTVAVVTHGGVIRSMTAHYLGMELSKTQLLASHLENCGITEFWFREDGTAVLNRFNDYSHLEGKDDFIRMRLRPVLSAGQVAFQAEEFRGKQAFHKNMDASQACAYLTELMGTAFKQAQAETEGWTASVLVSKKGKISIKRKPKAEIRKPADVLNDAWKSGLAHNRKKNYILEEGKAVPFLVDLGVMTKDGKIVNSRYDKFRQINRFLEFIEDILPKLDRSRESVILDFGCGKSYLTFAMYYYLKELKGYPVRIIGLDLKKDVIEKCNGLAVKYGYEKLAFYTGDIASYEGVDQVDMVVTLHACDTATDFALEKAVRWGAKVILSVPCCQHELNGQMENELLEPVLQYGIIRERMAALFTDALRARILECCGYRVQILEFIDMEHTPKNLLIRAVKQGGPRKDREELQAVLDFLHAEPTLYRLLMEQDD